MFNMNDAPVSQRELVEFAFDVARKVDRRCLDPDVTDVALAVEARAAVRLVVGGTHERAASVAAFDQMLARRPRMAAAVFIVAWAPATETPLLPAWIAIAVGTGGQPSLTVVRRIEEDERWCQLSTSELPWLALSTGAAGLRAALEEGAPLRLKSALDPGVLLQ